MPQCIPHPWGGFIGQARGIFAVCLLGTLRGPGPQHPSAVGAICCLLSAAVLQSRCFQGLVIFSRSIIESVLSKLVGGLLTLLYIVLLEIQKITLNCANIVSIGGRLFVVFWFVCFLEVSSIYSIPVKGN